MKEIYYFILIVLFAIAGGVKCYADNRPNIVFILTDDQHRLEFNFMPEGKNQNGDPRNLSPTIDKLVAEGILFPENHVVTAICTPSRYAILTGKYPSRAINENFIKKEKNSSQKNVCFDVDITDRDYTIAKVLQGAGYYTGGVGKNHVIKGGNSNLDHAIDKKLGADKVKSRLEQIQDKNVQAYKECGFDYAANLYPGNLPGFLPDELLFHNTDWIINGALDFLDQASEKQQPFFLYLATTVSHGPHKLGTKYKGDRRATAVGLLDKPLNIMPNAQKIEERISAAGLEDHAKDVLWLDDAIKVVTDKLKEIGALDNTIIFFMTDHGVEFGKYTCYEGGTKSPLVIWGPKYFKGNRTIDAYTSNIDYLPTIAEMCGVKIPDDCIVDGKSIMPLINNQKEILHKSLYHEIGATRAVLKDNWKYIAFRVSEYMQNLPMDERKRLANKGVDPYAPYSHTCDRPGGRGGESPALGHYPHYYDSDQLYDLKNDPDEQNNLANDPDYAEKLEEMKKELLIHLKNVPGTFGEFIKD